MLDQATGVLAWASSLTFIGVFVFLAAWYVRHERSEYGHIGYWLNPGLAKAYVAVGIVCLGLLVFVIDSWWEVVAILAWAIFMGVRQAMLIESSRVAGRGPAIKSWKWKKE